jgi:hypothetical protein
MADGFTCNALSTSGGESMLHGCNGRFAADARRGNSRIECRSLRGRIALKFLERRVGLLARHGSSTPRSTGPHER